MWVIKFAETIAVKMKASREPIPNHEKCEEFAAEAYKYCTELYGPPADPHKPYNLINGTNDTSICWYALGRYTISISPQFETIEEQCMIIGHEMYHRCTMHRKGMRQQLWVDELLAFVISHSFLKRQGYSDYAESYVQAYKDSREKLNVKKLREYPRPSLLNRLKNMGPKFYEEFYYDIAQLAIALKAILCSTDIYLILDATSLQQWINSLPEEKQYSVCSIMEVSSEGKKLPDNESDLSQFLSALKAKGDSEAAVAELQLLTELQPTNGTVFAYLTIASVCAEKWSAALDAYLKAQSLRLSESRLLSLKEGTYYLSKDTTPAVVWLQQAAIYRPDMPKFLYGLGCSLNSMGYLRVAHEAWEQILTLEDDKFKDLARKTIAENPLPNGLDEE